MLDTAHRRIRLPRRLLDQLDIHDAPSRSTSAVNSLHQSSGAQRTAARILKRTGHRKPSQAAKAATSRHLASHVHLRSHEANGHRLSNRSPGTQRPTKDVLLEISDQGSSDHMNHTDLDEDSQKNLSNKMKRKLDKEDATIVALERKLGIRKQDRLPKSFADDGLLDILDAVTDNPNIPRASDQLGESWLKKKRSKAAPEKVGDMQSESDFSGFSDSEDDVLVQRSSNTMNGAFQDLNRPSQSAATLVEEGTDKHFFRRRMRGVFNRLSEQNFFICLTEVEQILTDTPRKSAFNLFLENVLAQVGGSDTLSEMFLILHAGFLAAVYKVVGFDFGAEAVQQISNCLENALFNRETDAKNQQTAVNLVSVLTHLFSLGVISSELIYDFIRRFVTTISEGNTQLLLRIIKASGTQLRQQDPTSLKEIVAHLHAALAQMHDEDVSVRTRFMIETITDLKNHKPKGKINSSSIAIEYLSRMQKQLAKIDQHRIRAAEPLRVSLTDLHDENKGGKWWQPGANHRKDLVPSENLPYETGYHQHDLDPLGASTSIQQLASEQRMNTEVRRSVFVNIMAASDCHDAIQRLVGLRLRKSQESEIAKVLLHCVITEECYNPYYALIADQLCASRQMRISFQAALWEMLKRIEAEAWAAEAEEQLSGLRPVVHLARLFGRLLGTQRLDMKLLKKIEVEAASPQRRAFLEVLFLTVFRYVQRNSNESILEKSLSEIFQPILDDALNALAIKNFLQKTLRCSDMVASRRERRHLWLCCDTVERILSQNKPIF